MPETFPINSRTFNLAGENIDTDQIIPARFRFQVQKVIFSLLFQKD